MTIFTSIASIFDSTTSVSSTPPKRLQELETNEKIKNLRAQINSEEFRKLETCELYHLYTDTIKDLDIKNDYVTAYHACIKNPKAISLFSDEIKEHFKNGTSVFTGFQASTKEIDSNSTMTATDLSPARSDSPISTLSCGPASPINLTAVRVNLASEEVLTPIPATAITATPSVKIEQRALETFSKEFRSLAQQILNLKDKTISSLIEQVHTLDSKDYKQLSDQLAAYIKEKLILIISLKQKFCASFDKTQQAQAFRFMNGRFAEIILIMFSNGNMSGKQAFDALATIFIKNENKTFDELVKLFGVREEDLTEEYLKTLEDCVATLTPQMETAIKKL